MDDPQKEDQNQYGDTQTGLLDRIRTLTDQRLQNSAIYIDDEPGDLRRSYVLSMQPGDYLPYAKTDVAASIFVYVTTKLRRDDEGVLWAVHPSNIHIQSYTIDDPNNGAPDEARPPDDDIYFQLLSYESDEPKPKNAIRGQFL